MGKRESYKMQGFKMTQSQPKKIPMTQSTINKPQIPPLKWMNPNIMQIISDCVIDSPPNISPSRPDATDLCRQILIPCRKQLNEDLNSAKKREEENKKKIRPEGTALERNLKSLMFYIHFTWAEK